MSGEAKQVVQLQETSDADLVPYERGLPVTTTLKATLGRFLPGAALSLTAVFAFFLDAIPGPGLWIEALMMLGVGVGVLTLGFGAGLEALRRWLYPDAKADGRRSLVAGVMAPIAAFVAGTIVGPAFTSTQLLGLLFLVSLVTAFVMFFAWLTPTPEEMRDPEYRSDEWLLERAPHE